ncbi:hypothetical protein HHK36_015252 [Tetracentron sinense]|uniref:Uncharacterized protein n=1 Tax=Tetracentron sinense TaxID=13715 RepID=A0A835DDG8_TETSI|nr:hypothetical protein HHK36_015252 [Tetracentron sinense]
MMISEEASTAIPKEGSFPEEQWQKSHSNSNNNHSGRKGRLPRACTSRSSPRLFPVAPKTAPTKKERDEQLQLQQQCSKIITQLVSLPPPAQLPCWGLRSMWEFATLLNFLHVSSEFVIFCGFDHCLVLVLVCLGPRFCVFVQVFRPLLNISVEFSAEELETALITPNGTLDDIHIPLLKVGALAIPPITRMALGRATWVTVLCRKLRDWWHWVRDPNGDIPIFASHGTEVEIYKTLHPGIRVVILKALCDIRVEVSSFLNFFPSSYGSYIASQYSLTSCFLVQEDIRNYIDNSIKRGVQLSAFRKDRIGGDSHGISYWYEDDPIIGHRLYREIRKVEVKKVKAKGVSALPSVSWKWETVATNLDEFEDVSEKLFSSKNRTEAALGKKLKIDMLPEIETIHKRKERLLKKQHRQAFLLDSFVNVDGLASGRSLRDRKPVTYTFGKNNDFGNVHSFSIIVVLHQTTSSCTSWKFLDSL